MLSTLIAIALPVAVLNAQENLDGKYAIEGKLYYSHVSTQECVRGAMEGLQETGWGIRKPAAGATQFIAEFNNPQTTVLVDCENGSIVAATQQFVDGVTRDRQIIAAKTAIVVRFVGKYDFKTNQFSWKRPLTTKPIAWLTAPPTMTILYRRLSLKNPFSRCQSAAKIGLEGQAFKVAGATIRTPSGLNATLTCSYGEAIIVAAVKPAVVSTASAELSAILVGIGKGESFAPPSPEGEVRVASITASREDCRTKAAKKLAEKGFVVSQSPSVISGIKDSYEVSFFCLLDGVVAYSDTSSSYAFDVYAGLFTPGWTNPKANSSARISVISDTTGVIVLPHTLRGGDCSKVGAAALASSGYLEDGTRERYSGRVESECFSDLAMFIVKTEPTGGIAPQAELAQFAANWDAALLRPLWVSHGILPAAMVRDRSARMDFPFTPELSELATASGTRHISKTTDKGLTFVAWVQPALPGMSDDRRLDALVEQAMAEGLTVITTRKVSYGTDSSIAVWGLRSDPNGTQLRSVSRFIVKKGYMYVTEMTFPEGRDVSAQLTRFSDSLHIYDTTTLD